MEDGVSKPVYLRMFQKEPKSRTQMQPDYERSYLLMNAQDKVAFRFLVSVVNTMAYDDVTKTALECFLTWDILEDAMPFLTRPTGIYAIGGYGDALDTGNALDSVIRYDTTTDIWSTVASMPTTRSCPGVCVHDSFIYAVGGHDGGSNALDSDSDNDNDGSVVRYDTTTNIWSTVASMPSKRSNHGVV